MIDRNQIYQIPTKNPENCLRLFSELFELGFVLGRSRIKNLIKIPSSLLNYKYISVFNKDGTDCTAMLFLSQFLTDFSLIIDGDEFISQFQRRSVT
jgi:hypothetical protein